MDIVVKSSLFDSGITTEEKHDAGHYYQNILTCLDYPEDCPPVADLLRRYHTLEGQWLIASPVHWQATHNDAMIMACDEALNLSDDESRQWFSALSEFLCHDRIKLHYHDAYTWLIQFENPPPIHAKPVNLLLQKSMMLHLKALDVTLFWSRFITESQMFLSGHALNKSRDFPINGVWIWGEGRLKTRSSRAIVCGDEEGYALAELLSTRVSFYKPGEKTPRNALVLLPNLNAQQAAWFEKNRVHWYWNNIQYITKPKSWFIRWSLCT
jgi:hypothetical protein